MRLTLLFLAAVAFVTAAHASTIVFVEGVECIDSPHDCRLPGGNGRPIPFQLTVPLTNCLLNSFGWWECTNAGDTATLTPTRFEFLHPTQGPPPNADGFDQYFVLFNPEVPLDFSSFPDHLNLPPTAIEGQWTHAPGGTHAALYGTISITSVPEPVTWVMIGIALAALLKAKRIPRFDLG